MNLKAELARAEALQLQIKQLKREIEDIHDRVTRETFWLKAGDIIVLERRQRQHLIGKVQVERFYYVVELISSYDSKQYKEDCATLWLWRVHPESGKIDRNSGGRIRYYGHRVIRRLGHLEDYQTVGSLDPTVLGANISNP